MLKQDHGKFNFRDFSDIEAYKYAKRKASVSNHMTVLSKPSGSSSRPIAKVLLDEQDNASFTSSQGLRYLCHGFERNHQYVNHSYTALTKQLGFFRWSKMFLKLFLPWNVCSGQVTKEFVKDIQRNPACRYITLKKSCVKQCEIYHIATIIVQLLENIAVQLF